MNARLYDPTIHRFLQPDTVIQDPTNTQNYNRYGYCLNNPLKYTDVSGNEFNIATVAGCIPIVGSIYAALLMHQPINWERVGVDLVVTGISCAVTFGIGGACSSIANFYVKATVEALAHGVFQGGLTAVQGGKFWAGFAAGALSSIACSAWKGGTDTVMNPETGLREGIAGTGMKGIGGKFADSTVGTLAFGAVMGGAGSAIGGGNFWQVAVTGLIVAGFNHLMHSIKEKQNLIDRLRNVGYDYKEAADYGKLSLLEFAQKVFPDLNSEANYPSFRKAKNLIVDGLEADGITEYDFNTYSVKSITIAKSAFSTFLKLASTVGHELIHAGDMYNGNMRSWVECNNKDYAKAMSEIRAYEWNSNQRLMLPSEFYFNPNLYNESGYNINKNILSHY